MKIDIITLFPEMFKGPFDESIIKRARDKKKVTISIYQLRNWAIDKRGTVDDRPYGGGAGMILRPEPIFNAVEAIKKPKKNTKIILLDAAGEIFTQKKAREYAQLDQVILICGHYEGVDYRVHKFLADDCISIGDFVLTGGELPAMIITDSIVRLIPGVLKKKQATAIESFSSSDSFPLLEYPQYTRPRSFKGHRVPSVLLSGNHKTIQQWQKQMAHKRTKKFRPHFFKKKK